MKYKKIGGWIALIIGATLLVFGFYGKQRMKQARGDIDSASSLIPENPVTGFIEGRLHGEVDKYKLPVTVLFIGGAVFIIVGASLLCFHPKK